MKEVEKLLRKLAAVVDINIAPDTPMREEVQPLIDQVKELCSPASVDDVLRLERGEGNRVMLIHRTTDTPIAVIELPFRWPNKLEVPQ